MIHYDPSGTGQVIDIDELEQDFRDADSRMEDYKSPYVKLTKNFSDILEAKTPRDRDGNNKGRVSNNKSWKEDRRDLKPEQMSTLERYRQELELINSTAKAVHKNVNSWIRNCSKDERSLDEFEWKRAIDSLKIKTFVDNPNLNN